MKGLHTHKVIAIDNGQILTTGTKEACEKYREEWPPFLGALAIGENTPEEIDRFSQSYVDTVKEACFAACKEVNPNDPLRAAASYSTVIEMLELCVIQLQTTDARIDTKPLVIDRATKLLEILRK